MLTVRIPATALYECQQYLAHNGQYPNKEYYLKPDEDHNYTLSFSTKYAYLAFCYRWSKIIL